MSRTKYTPSNVDLHVARRIQLRRNMMGLSQKDLAAACHVTFQQIQKYETAGNRISASRLFELSQVLQTPISFFFFGIPGNVPEPTRNGRLRVSDSQPDDPLGKNESLELIRLYWKLPGAEKRKLVMDMLRALNTSTQPENDA